MRIGTRLSGECERCRCRDLADGSSCSTRHRCLTWNSFSCMCSRRANTRNIRYRRGHRSTDQNSGRDTKTHRVIIEEYPTLLGGIAYSALCECDWRSKWFDTKRGRPGASATSTSALPPRRAGQRADPVLHVDADTRRTPDDDDAIVSPILGPPTLVISRQCLSRNSSRLCQCCQPRPGSVTATAPRSSRSLTLRAGDLMPAEKVIRARHAYVPHVIERAVTWEDIARDRLH